MPSHPTAPPYSTQLSAERIIAAVGKKDPVALARELHAMHQDATRAAMLRIEQELDPEWRRTLAAIRRRKQRTHGGAKKKAGSAKKAAGS